VDRARPFIEAGLPVFIDKPLTDRADHLKQFIEWQEAGHPIMSTSCMRYATEYRDALNSATDIGDLRLVTVTMAKTWERYGIHALEAVYPVAEPGGYERVSLSTTDDTSIVHLTHRDGVHFVLSVVKDMVGPFGHMSLFGTAGRADAQFNNTFGAFKAQLEAFVHYLRTGKSPVPFAETVEQMRIIIAGIRSRENNGAPVYLDEI
jgi:predicted dehydrogenase